MNDDVSLSRVPGEGFGAATDTFFRIFFPLQGHRGGNGALPVAQFEGGGWVRFFSDTGRPVSVSVR